MSTCHTAWRPWAAGLLLSAFSIFTLAYGSAQGSVVLGTGTGALLGGDLTDPDNNINDNVAGNPPYYGSGYDWLQAAASAENYFSPGGPTNEAALDLFDNKVGGGSDKWYNFGQNGWVAVQLGQAWKLTHFTIASANDVAGRDPDIWYIQGSNDSTNGADGTWDNIFTYNNDGVSPWGTTRLQVIQWTEGDDYTSTAGYTWFKFQNQSTVNNNDAQLSEIEFFGTTPFDATRTSTGDNFWDVPTTWNPAGTPGANDYLTVDDTDTVTSRLTNDVGGRLDIIDNGDVGVQAGATLAITGNVDSSSSAPTPLNIGGTLSAGNLNVQSGTVALGPGATLLIGGTGSIASLTTNGNATVGGAGNIAVSGSTFDGGGVTGTLTKTGPGTLSLDNSDGTGVIGVQNLTFDVNEGTLFSRGAQPLGGTSPTTGVPAGVILSGGTLSVEGGAVIVPNQLDYAFYDNAASNNLQNIDDGVDNNANGGLFALTPSPQSDWPAQVQGQQVWTGEVWQGGNISDTYCQMWSGKVNVPAGMTGDFTVYVHGDDYEVFWLDVGQDGDFDTGTDDISRNVEGEEGWNTPHTETVTLTGGQTYDFAIAHREGAGGDFVNVEITPPAWTGMPAFRINPSDPDQDGLWARTGVGGIDMTGTPITVTANSRLNAISDVPPAAFGDLTLNNGTTLTTTGADMTFSSVAVAGGAGRTGTLAAENLVTMSNYTDGGTPTTLVMGGTGTLRVDNTGGGISAANTTFEATAGRLEAGSGAQHPLGGSTQLTLSGGTASFGDVVSTSGIIPANPLAYWKFDETSGDVVHDETGNFDGTRMGDAAWTNDAERGQVLSFDGTGDYVDIPAIATNLNAATYAVWVNMGKVPPDNMDSLMHNDTWNGGDIHYLIRSNGAPGFCVNGAGPNDQDGDPVLTAAGEWHLVAATYDAAAGGLRQYYFDGVPAGTQTHSNNRTVNIGPAQIAAWNGGREFEGMYDDFIIYDRVLTGAEIANMLGARMAPDVSDVNVHVTNPAAPSTLESRSLSPLAFADLTLDDGTTLRTTGTSDMSFSSVAVAGPAGRRATLLTDNNVTTANYSDGGISTMLVKDGSGTLTLAKGGTLSAAATTFQVARGTFAVSEPDELGGAQDVVLTGGTFQVAGEITMVSGMRGSIFFGTADNENPVNLDGATYQASASRVFTGDKAGTILTMSEDPGDNVVVTGSTYDWAPFPNFSGGADHFVTAYSGRFTPRATGDHNFRWDNDDRGLMYVDVNDDNVFDASERVAGYAWSANGTVYLDQTRSYNAIYMAQEFSGGQGVRLWMTDPLGGEAVVNPGDGRGTWETLGAGPIDIQATLTVDNGPADALMGSIFFGIPRDESHLNLDGANYQHSTTRVLTGDKADTILTDAEDPNNNTVITGSTQNWDSFPNFGGGADDFVTAFSGQFTPRVSGTHNFHWDNDDRGLMYVDLNGNGTFENSERVAGYAWNANGNVDLTAGQAYSVIYMAQEFAGGQSVNWYFTEPGGSETRVNPGDPAQAGLWSTPGLLSTSTLELVTDSTANLRELVLKNGNLRIIGGTQLSIEQASVDPATGGAVGLITETPTILTGVQGFNGNSADVTITKAGGATLTINRPGTGLENANLRVQDGTLHAFLPEPFGAAGTTVTLAGGTFRATGETLAGAIVPPALGQWTFDADNADDSSGNANNGIVGGSLVFQSDTPAGIGSARSLRSQSGGGAGNVVTVPTSASLESINDVFSIAYWMKSDLGDNGNWVRIFQHGTEANGDRTWLVDRYSGNNDVNVRVDTTGQFNQNIAVGGPAVFDGTWHHVVFTLDSGSWHKYVDGAEVGTGTYNHGDGLTNTRDLYMFGRNGVGEYVGSLDEIYLFDVALTASEVAGLYSNSHLGAIDLTTTNIRVAADSTLHAETDLSAAFGNLTYENGTMSIVGAPGGVTFTGGGLDPAATTFGVNNPMDVTINGPFDGGGATASFTKGGGGQYTLPQGTTNHGGVSVGVQAGRLVTGGPMQAANLNIGGAGNADTGANDVTISDGGQFRAGTLKISGSGATFGVGGDNMAAGPQRLIVNGGQVDVRVGGTAGVVAYWPFETGSGTVAYDQSGGGHDGNITGAAWVNDPARGWVLDFEDADYVDIPDASAAFASVNDAVTIAFWQYGDEAIQPQDDFMFEFGVGGTRYLGSHLPWSNSNVYWDAGGSTGCCNDRLNQAANPADFEGQWNHWVLTKDTITGEQKIFLNGTEWASATGRTIKLGGINTARIGSNMGGGNNYDGMIDDFVVFDRALTVPEIQALYDGTLFDVQAINLPNTDVMVTADATLFADTPTTATFGNLSMGAGVNLTLDGAPGGFTFAGVAGGHSIAATDITVNGMLDPGGDPTDPDPGVDPDFQVAANLTLGSGATYRWELGPDTDGDRIGEPDAVHVGGDLTLADWTLALVDAEGESHARQPLPLLLGFDDVTWDPSLVSFDMSEAPSWLAFTDPASLRVLRLDGPQGDGLYLLGLQTAPEPSTLVLGALGLLGLGFAGWRRRRRRC